MIINGQQHLLTHLLHHLASEGSDLTCKIMKERRQQLLHVAAGSWQPHALTGLLLCPSVRAGVLFWGGGGGLGCAA